MPVPVLVLGCGSSGTSLVAWVLNRLGVPLDSDVTEKAETRRIETINEALLKVAGGSWHAPRVASLNRRPTPKNLGRRMAHAVRKWRARETSWLWKDPRFSLTWSHWHWLLAPWVAVIVVRNPIEVSTSLRTHYGLMDQRRALALWELYTRCAVLGARTARARIVVHYADLLLQPEATCLKLDQFLSAAGVVRGPADLSGAAALPRPKLSHDGRDGSLHRISPSQADLYCSLIAGQLPVVTPDLEQLEAALP